MRPSSDGRQGYKLGEVVAEQIENDIIAAGWPVGSVLGSENELIERYGVSRAIFREAMRIVDHHGVATMRRGPGGGLVVLEPELSAVVRTVSLHLQYRRLGPEQVTEARKALELNCVRAATENLDDNGRRSINEFLAAEYEAVLHGREGDRASDDRPSNDFHLLLADLTGNPAMRLFVETLGRVTSQKSPRSADLEAAAVEVNRVHTLIAKAMLAGDADTAERRMKQHLEALVAYLKADIEGDEELSRQQRAAFDH